MEGRWNEGWRGSAGARSARVAASIIACLLAVLVGTTPGPAWGAELPIPELARWEERMLSTGHALCDYLAEPRTFDELLGATYYDAERVFYQIAEYTNDIAWVTCAQRAEAVYRDQYTLPAGGSVPGYWNLTRGLALDYRYTADPASKDAAVRLSENAMFARDGTPLEYTVSADYSQEVAYAILSYLDAERVGAPQRARLAQLVDQALGHIDQWFVSRTATRIAPYLVGLTAEALIQYYGRTQDARIPPAIKLAMDWLWANAWIPGQEAFWYDSFDTSVAAPDENLLIAPAFAWLYRQTGDPAYRDRGDQIFAAGVRLGFIYSGKHFNQSYRWSFDYVKWRTAGPLAPPGLADWQGAMVTYGQMLCDYLARPLTLDELLSATYYDAERVFYQIAEHTGDPAWVTCAQRAEAVYRDLYVLPAGGSVPGFWNFTRGLALDYLQTGDLLSQQAVILLSENAMFARDGTPLEFTASADASREVAYAILSYLDAQTVGAPQRARLAQLVDQALGHIDQWFVTGTATKITPFMVGLTAEALIRYYERTQDPRIPPAIKTALDGLWADAWMPGEEAFWHDSLDPSVAAPDMNLLIAPTFAWLYRQTGDPAYRDRGDQIFAGGVEFGFVGSGKHFNQAYRWSFDYVRWRAAAPLPSLQP